ncbi:MAG: putative DNA binding domain-containing protein [Candidatus Omnitrophica bacterium]|nr:putative DNA binding domain-containing protein [Candidatus Omnitrophota bacterium]
MTKEEQSRNSTNTSGKISSSRRHRGAPEDAYKTVSAFANTAGGHLVFGIKDTDGRLEIVGVIDVDKVQNDFLSCLRAGDKLNRIITVDEDAIEHEGKVLLVFYIPESPRREKPIFLRGDIRQSYIRRGGGDEQCTQAEIQRFIRDADLSAYDGDVLADIDAEEFFDPDTMAWYRRLFQEREENRDAELSDVEFLNEWGFVVEANGTLVPTRAAVLLFGKGRYVRQTLPRGVVDYQRIDVPFDEWDPVKRWQDRVVIEENILTAWQILVEKYLRLADRPFSIDSSTLRRQDDPPDYISFREATINLLIHQDYGDHTRTPVIQIFADRTVFWNPGDAVATVDELLDPSAKEVRNPAIVSAFRRIGLSDQAGTGVRSIVSNWRNLGYIPPLIENDKADKTFQLGLLKEILLTEDQLLLQSQLGVHLSDQEAALFAFACRTDSLDLTDAKSLIGGGNRGAQEALNRLVVQNLLQVVEQDVLWEVAEHLKQSVQATDQASDQAADSDRSLVTPLLTKLSDQQKRIIELCEIPRKQAQLMDIIGVTHRTFFRRKHLDPLVRAKLIRMTHPEEPNHPDQAYVVTETAVNLLSAWKSQKKAPEKE